MADWVTVEVNLDPILEPINPIIESLDSVLGFLITILNIVQTILNVIKVFLVGLLDPLRTIVEVIVAEIRALIRDLRQLGLYLTGDWELLTSEDKFSNLIGGYQSYERRMIGRLQDRADPSRPDFSSSSTALGAFFYVSSGDINELVRVIKAFLKFFGQGDLAGKGSPYGRPTAPEMKYGTDGASTAAFRDLAASSADALPDAVSVTWSMPSGTGGIGQLFSPAPKGFLIHVSTIPDGFNVLSLTPKDTDTAEVEDLPRVFAAAVDPTSNGALKLYGGVADIGVSSDSTSFTSVENSDPRAPNLVLQKDQNTPLIKPSLLASGDIPLVANTYFVATSFLTRTGPGSKYTATFAKDLLPRGASFISANDGFAKVDGSSFEANTFFFRIRALTDDYVAKLGLDDATLQNPISVYKGSNVRPYRFSPGLLREARNGVLVPEPPGNDGDNGSDLTAMSFTAASSAGIAEFPTAAQASYVQAVQAAIALVVLCRADLTEAALDEETGFPIFSRNVYNPGFPTGLEGAGRDLLARYGITPIWFKGNRPQQFRLKMRWLMARVASDLQSRAAPPDTLASVVVADAQPLLDFKWHDLDEDFPRLTILQSLDADRVGTEEISGGIIAIGTRELSFEYDEDKGIGSNPFCRSQAKKNLVSSYNSTAILSSQGGADKIPQRAPSFLKMVANDGNPAVFPDGLWLPGEGSADFSPIVYNDSTNRVEYIRNAFLDRPDIGDEVLGAAAAVLQLATAPLSRPIGDTNWIAIRLMPQALAPLDDLLERLDRFLQGILDGLEGTIDKIIAYIEAIQARIYQLQALLEQIRALLRALDFFALPSVSGLVVVESGTDGLTAGLVTSTNKPFDSSSSYGAGIAVVAGGLPSVLLELLGLILGSGGDN